MFTQKSGYNYLGGAVEQMVRQQKYPLITAITTQLTDQTKLCITEGHEFETPWKIHLCDAIHLNPKSSKPMISLLQYIRLQPLL